MICKVTLSLGPSLSLYLVAVFIPSLSASIKGATFGYHFMKVNINQFTIIKMQDCINFARLDLVKKVSWSECLGKLKSNRQENCVWCGEWTVHYPSSFSFSCFGARGGMKAKSSQVPDMFPKKVPNSTSLLSHMLWQMLSSFHLYRWAKVEDM
jgi:hypothetical protein